MIRISRDQDNAFNEIIFAGRIYAMRKPSKGEAKILIQETAISQKNRSLEPVC